MEPKQIDIIGLEPLQGRIQRSMDMLGPEAGGIGMRTGRKTRLRRKDDAVAHTACVDEPAQNSLALAIGVDIGGIDKISARIDVAVENRLGFRRIRAPIFASEGHRAK